jgi:hypothetical protein
LAFIESHNARADKTFTMAMNHFGDLTHTEFKRFVVGGFRHNATKFQESSKGRLFVGAVSGTDSWDWRNKGA